MNCTSFTVSLDEYPYDPFLIVLLPSRRGEIYREHNVGQAIAAIANTWNGWETGGVEYQHCEDAIRAAVESAVDNGELVLTRVEAAGSRTA